MEIMNRSRIRRHVGGGHIRIPPPTCGIQREAEKNTLFCIYANIIKCRMYVCRSAGAKPAMIMFGIPESCVNVEVRLLRRVYLIILVFIYIYLFVIHYNVNITTAPRRRDTVTPCRRDTVTLWHRVAVSQCVPLTLWTSYRPRNINESENNFTLNWTFI